MKYIASILLLLGAVAFLGGCSTGADVTAATQTTCPVMGGEIKKDLFFDHFTVNEDGTKGQGKRIYFCCPGCLDTIKASPDKIVEKLESQGVTLEPIATCSSSKTSCSSGQSKTGCAGTEATTSGCSSKENSSQSSTCCTKEKTT